MRVETDIPLDRWNEWVETHFSPVPLTAHGAWVEVLRQEGVPVENFFIRDANDRIIAGCSVQFVRTSYVTYCYSPRGPLCLPQVDTQAVIKALGDVLVKRRLIFWRIEPNELSVSSLKKYHKTPDVQPAVTLLLDMSATSEELLANMHQKTRYNIRLAQKKGLTVRWEKNPDLFWTLSSETSKRDGFRLHPRRHYETVIASARAEQVTVFHHETAIASAVTTLVGDTYTYLYGASSYDARALMAPYLIQWSAIERAKECGARWYDFYGLTPLSSPVMTSRFLSHEEYGYDQAAKEAGYTRFKLGFGGKIWALPGTWDIAFSSSRYKLYRMIRALRKRFFM